MRMMLIARFPHEPFNAAVRNGTADATLKQILQELKPEAVYFTELDGRRTGILVVEMKDAASIPRLVEPFFLRFGADVEIHPVMTPEDLGRAGLDALGKQWS